MYRESLCGVVALGILLITIAACAGVTQPVLPPTPYLEVVPQISPAWTASPPTVALVPLTPTAFSSPTIVPSPSPSLQPSPTATSKATLVYTPMPSATPGIESTPTPTPVVPTLRVIGERVNVRQGPGTNYPVIGQARRDETYEITGRNPLGGWWEFKYRDRIGWINAALVQANVAAETIAVARDIPASPTPKPTPLVLPTSKPERAETCPAWYQAPLPGMGVVVIENHDTGTHPAIFEEIGVPGQQALAPKVNDVPGRLILQLNPGRHTFKVDFPACYRCELVFDVDVETGRSYVVPIVRPPWKIEIVCEFCPPGKRDKDVTVYPLVLPPGCP